MMMNISDRCYFTLYFVNVGSLVVGADTPLFLSLLPENEQTMRGKFVSERKIVKWE